MENVWLKVTVIFTRSISSINQSSAIFSTSSPGPVYFRHVCAGPNGVAFLDLPEGSPLLGGMGQCKKPSCSFNPSTMSGQVDMSDCKMISFGATDGSGWTMGWTFCSNWLIGWDKLIAKSGQQLGRDDEIQ